MMYRSLCKYTKKAILESDPGQLGAWPNVAGGLELSDFHNIWFHCRPYRNLRGFFDGVRIWKENTETKIMAPNTDAYGTYGRGGNR
jgi:hypothetical protein